MSENDLIDLPRELASLIEWEADTPVFLAQALARIARGECASPIRCPQRLDQALRQLCAGLDAQGDENAHGHLRIDYSRAGATHADGPSERPEAAGDDELRCVAMRNARVLWNHALETLVRREVDTGSFGDWSIAAQGQWRNCAPRGHRYPEQGWKIHVSATPNNAPEVLRACMPVLLAQRVAFKHAARLDHVESLTSAKCNRGNGGKFITVYPDHAEHARRLLAELDEVTRGFDGPQILSDRAYREGGLVYYRYGVFSARAELSNDGVYEARLCAPDGTHVSDSRKAWFEPPAWVEPLFPEQVQESHDVTPSVRPAAVMLKQRYRVTAAIRHANRGGVYRAIDENDGRAVIVKQARPHTSAELSGHDAVDSLHKEAQNLKCLAGLGADFIDLFEYQGHTFLVQSAIEGRNLRDWLSDRCEASPDAGPGLERSELRALAIRVTEMLAEIHRRGLACRDFNPNNLMVEADGQLRLIDPELMDRPGSFVYRYYTYGFGAPELLGTDKATRCPDFSVDAYSLGGVLFCLLTGRMPPVFLASDSSRSLRMRWQLCTRDVRRAGYPALADLILELTQWAPERRVSVAQALERLREASFWAADAVRAPAPSAPPTELQPPEIPTLIREGTAFMLAQRDARGARMWPSGSFGGTTDECNVQHGAGGVLGYLAALADPHRPVDCDHPLREIAHWIDLRLARRQRHLPGLYFGSAGAALACLHAADRIGDFDLRQRALERLCALPLSWPNPDVCHGLAGTGIALCEAWQSTHDTRLPGMIDACADQLIATMRRHANGIHWTIAEDFDSALKGVSHLGFAHGVAGIAHFLLLAGLVREREDCIRIAIEAGHTLAAAADSGVWGARWRSSVDKPASAAGELNYYWCSGSSGIGSLLARLWHVCRIERFRECAEQAALAVHRIRWHSGSSVCHGLAGNGEFLIDAARFMDPRFQSMAEDLVDCLRLKITEHEGARLIVDESETGVTADFNTGLSGILAFLHRLETGAPRLWMGDAVVIPAGGRCA